MYEKHFDVLLSGCVVLVRNFSELVFWVLGEVVGLILNPLLVNR